MKLYHTIYLYNKEIIYGCLIFRINRFRNITASSVSFFFSNLKLAESSCKLLICYTNYGLTTLISSCCSTVFLKYTNDSLYTTIIEPFIHSSPNHEYFTYIQKYNIGFFFEINIILVLSPTFSLSKS